MSNRHIFARSRGAAHLLVVPDYCEHGVRLSNDHPRAVQPGSVVYDPACTVRRNRADYMRPHLFQAKPAA